MQSSFTPAEQQLIALWERHMRCEFVERDPAATIETMSADGSVNHVPVMTGGRDRREALRFYAEHFLPKIPADMAIDLVSRTVGQGRIVDELIVRFTHDREMDWMVPGVAPTGRKVEVPFVVVIQCADDAITCERIYWDQASVLVQLGLLDAHGLPVAGAETARKVVNPGLPSNELMRRVAVARSAAGTAGAARPLQRWSEFAGQRPELAEAARALIYQYRIGLGYLASIRKDGSPRVHPVCPVIAHGGLYVFIGNHSPKLHDLRRDGRYALHSFPQQDVDDEFMVAGRARRVDDRAVRDVVYEAYTATGATTSNDTLFELLLERALHAKYGPRPSWPPVYTKWISA